MSHALLGEKVDEVTNHDRRLSGVSVDSGRAIRCQRSVPKFWTTAHRVRHYSIRAIRAGHYCTVKVIPKTKWAKGKTPVIVIGNHAFFKIGLDGKG